MSGSVWLELRDGCDSVDQLSGQEPVSEEMTALFQSTCFSFVSALISTCAVVLSQTVHCRFALCTFCALSSEGNDIMLHLELPFFFFLMASCKHENESHGNQTHTTVEMHY